MNTRQTQKLATLRACDHLLERREIAGPRSIH